MKFTASLLTCLLAGNVLARARPAADGDPSQQYSRITAFVIDDKGAPSIECWEVSFLGSNSQEITQADGSKAKAHSLPLAKGDQLDGVEILTWPSLSSIWPPTNTVRSERLDLVNTFNLFSIQGGLINFNFYLARFGSQGADAQGDDDVETHIFSLENGDDWFYFEDSTDYSIAASTPSPFEISTVSATETELLRLKYSSRPSHKVIHKGACQFTGIHVPSDDSSSRKAKQSRPHSDLTVQVVLGDGDL